MDVKLIQGTATITNAADAYTGTLSVGVTAYVNGALYMVYPNASNTTASPSLSLNGIGVTSILRENAVAAKIGDIKANTWLVLLFSLSDNAFIMINPNIPNTTIVANTLFVNKNGNDTSATIGRMDRAYLTIGAAQSAASAGQTIIVYPGTYSESGLGKAGINHHFINGAIVSSTTSNMWVDTGNISYNISGDGEFNSTTGKVIYMTGSGTIDVVAKILTSTTGNIFDLSSSSTLSANIQKYIISTSGINILLASTATAYIRTPLISCGNFATAIAQSVVATTTLYLTADSIASSGTRLFNLSGNAEVRGKMVYTGSSVAIINSAVACSINFYGDISSTSIVNSVIGYTSASTGTHNFYGKITGSDINVNGYTGTITFYDTITTNKSTSASINPVGGTVKIKGRLVNTDANAASYGIDLSNLTGTCVLENAIIVTGAGNASSIYASGAKNVVVLGTAMANNNKDANITILSGNLIVNSNVS